MSLPPDSGGDTIDCVPQLGNQKKNCHEHPLTCNSDSLSPETSSPERLSYTKDGHYFLPLLKGEIIRLLKLSDLTQRDISMLAHTCVDIDEDVLGFLRSVTGKTKLLVSQKFKQFEDLCNSNINSTPDEDFPITNEDLMGFWDMLNLQIQHVDKLYKEVDQIRKNNWQTIEEIPTTPTDTSIFKRSQRLSSKTPSATTKMSPSATLLTQKREAQRKQLLELKQKNKGLNKDSKSPSVEIYISHNDV